MLEFARGIVRPLALTIAIGATVAMIFTKTAIPDAWWGMAGTMVSYFFVSRQQAKP